MAPKIFISYRRADSAYATDSIYAVLANLFGKENVFLDVGSIPFGVDFRAYLRDQIAAHDVVLVMIGPEWGRIMQERAAQPNDFVRVEIENALAQNKLVIPVLVMNASMPDFSGLPASIQDLQWRNSATIRRQPNLEQDCKQLADGITTYFATIGVKAKPRSIDLLPAPFAWVEIAGGFGFLETKEFDDFEDIASELAKINIAKLPIARINNILTIPSERYWIARYPVTNGQFALFIEAGGYSTKRWWTEAGWKAKAEGRFGDRNPWTKPRYWQESPWNGAEQPVTGVSLYEAVAFCLWLSDATGEKIMLPTEAQWQYAAQGNDGRAYPWGNDWDGSRCNNSVDAYNSDVTTSVRQFEGKGDSPFSVVDMAGNVMEWCLTDYYSQSNDLKSGLRNPVYRGGSWKDSNSYEFRADFRPWVVHDLLGRYSGFGFRICCSS